MNNKRPNEVSPGGRSTAVSLRGNFFKVDIGANIYIYSIKFVPEIGENPIQKIRDVIRENRETMAEKFEKVYFISNNHIYSPKSPSPFNLDAKIDGVDYKVAFTQSGMFHDEPAAVQSNFLGRFFKTLQGKLKLKKIGRKYFNSDESKNVNAFEIWPGFETMLSRYTTGFYLNINVAHKIIRKDNVNQFIVQMKARSNSNFEEDLREALQHRSIITRYNKTIYAIDDINFAMTPMNSFTQHDGTEITYFDYYNSKYKEVIQDKTQPLLVHIPRKGAKEIYLIPELCLMTGFTEAHLGDRNLMNEMHRAMKPQIKDRITEACNFPNKLMKADGTRDFLKDWEISIQNAPSQLNACKLKSGNLVMGDNKEFDLDKNPNLDRCTQGAMFSQDMVKNLLIFCPKRNFNDAKKLLDTLGACFDDCKIPRPSLQRADIENENSLDCWVQTCKSRLTPNVTAVIFMLPGAKGKGKFYDEIKRLCFNDYPVPSQVVLLKTIQAGKNLRSIISRVIIQIIAKAGGIPWIVDTMPFTDMPTMVMSYSIIEKSKVDKSIFACCATMNRNLTKYWSDVKYEDKGKSITPYLETSTYMAIMEFKRTCGRIPYHVIVIREGVASNQAKSIIELEVRLIKQGINKVLREEFPDKASQDSQGNDLPPNVAKEINLVYVNIGRAGGAKFFEGDQNNMRNPGPGTYIYDTFTNDPNEFYLISANCRNGMVIPINYRVFHNDLTDLHFKNLDEVKKDLAILFYKLCYLYYNTVGSIKVPAPVHLVNRLAKFVNEHSSRRELISPHQHLGAIKSLYFI